MPNANIESKARRVARAAGLFAHKSRRGESVDNFGGFMLLDNDRNWVVQGSRFELTAEDVIDYCSR